MGGAVSSEGTEWRVTHNGVVVRWRFEGDEAVVVVKDLGIPLDRRHPVLVGAALVFHLGLLDLIGIGPGVVVVGSCRDPIHELLVGLEPSVSEKRKVFENVVARMLSDPRSVGC